MKKIFFSVCFLVVAIAATAQYEKEEGDDEDKKFFKKENLFTGGSVTASFFNGSTVLGISPYFGYSINRYVDVAISANWNYFSQRDVYFNGDKIRQKIIGPGAFVRLYPLKFLFAHAQYEHNFLTQKYIAVPNSGFANDKLNFNVASALVGGGYCSGREGTGDLYYYFSVMWDLKKNFNSPYVDELGRTIPIVRAGLQIPLFQGGKRRF